MFKHLKHFEKSNLFPLFLLLELLIKEKIHCTVLLINKCLLISWLQSPSAVILEPQKIKSLTVSIVSPSICYEVMGLDAMILVLWMLSFKQVGTAAMELKGTCSLEEKLWPT